jgi:predicted transposase YdaD
LDPGINKPFDRIAKEFAEEAPAVFLRLLGIAPAGAEIVLEPLRPETAPQVVMPDYVASLSIAREAFRTLHVEFFLQYRDTVPVIIARYGGSLAWQYRRPVTSILVLLKNEGVPDEIPPVGEYAIGETKVTHPFRTVRLWELDPEPLLAGEDPGLLPWALLMKLSREEAERLGARIGASGNEQWIARFLTLGSLRYHRLELERMLERGGPGMGLVEAIVEGSSIVREQRELAAAEGLAKGLEQGLEKGLEQGLEKGQSVEARRILKLALAKRFPGLEDMSELDRIDGVTELESILLEQVLGGKDRDSVVRAIRRAVFS